MIDLLLAQDPLTSASDLLKATEVLPFFKALAGFFFATTVGAWVLWQRAEHRRDAEQALQLERLTKINERLTGAREGDSRA